VILWDGFYDPASITAWTQAGAGGDWFWQDGTVVQQIASAGERTLFAPGSYQHVSVATAFSIGALQSGGMIGVCSGIVPASHQYCCVVYQTGPAILATTNGSPSFGAWPSTLNANDHIEMVQNTATDNSCTVTMGASVHSTTSSSLGATPGTLQFYMANASATYDYVFVVELGP
jgi:hypothetical protein